MEHLQYYYVAFVVVSIEEGRDSFLLVIQILVCPSTIILLV